MLNVGYWLALFVFLAFKKTNSVWGFIGHTIVYAVYTMIFAKYFHLEYGFDNPIIGAYYSLCITAHFALTTFLAIKAFFGVLSGKN